MTRRLICTYDISIELDGLTLRGTMHNAEYRWAETQNSFSLILPLNSKKGNDGQSKNQIS